MNKIINYDNLRQFAYSNDKLIKGEIKGIVLNFSGCSIYTMYDTDTHLGKFYAEHGVIFIIPYYNPWAWMNKFAVNFVDEIVDVIFEKYDLSDTPIASTGGSMGGYCAIMYTLKGKRTPEICAALCPVCDLLWHFYERPNIPRTLYSAFAYEDGCITDIIKANSPMELVETFPKTAEYHLFHGDNDEMVNYTAHSKRFYEKMKEKGYDITFQKCKGRTHATVAIDGDIPAKEYILKKFKIEYDELQSEFEFNHTV